MPFDDTNFDFGDYGMPEKLVLSGVYKRQVQGPADYCAYGRFEGEEFLISEASVKAGLQNFEENVLGGEINNIVVDQDVRKPALGQISLSVAEARMVLQHIENIAPQERPNPLGAVA